MTHNDQINLQTTEGFFFIIVAVARILAFSSKRERGAASQHCWRNSFFEGYIRKPAIFFLNAGGGGEKKTLFKIGNGLLFEQMTLKCSFNVGGCAAF